MDIQLGIDTVSLHSQSGRNTVTPGIYAIYNGTMAGGIMRNSWGRISRYGAWVWSDKTGHWGLMVGGITGYSRARVLPLALPSYRLTIAPNAYARLSAIPNPWGASALHLSFEYQLK